MELPLSVLGPAVFIAIFYFMVGLGKPIQLSILNYLSMNKTAQHAHLKRQFCGWALTIFYSLTHFHADSKQKYTKIHFGSTKIIFSPPSKAPDPIIEGLPTKLLSSKVVFRTIENIMKNSGGYMLCFLTSFTAFKE